MSTHVVIGGSGFIGSHLTRALTGRGDDVIVIARHPPLDGISGVVYERGDARLPSLGLSADRIAHIRALCPVVWNLAANLSFRDEEFRAVQTDNTLIATHGSAFANTVGERYIFVSTVYVSGKPSSAQIAEQAIEAPVHRKAYESSKWEAESIVRSQTKIPFVILRPSIVIGDAYPEHAVGCTFGYYRYSYMFYVFKEYLATLRSTSRLHPLVLLFGIRNGSSRGRIACTRLIVPFPFESRVNMVPVGHVVAVMTAILSSEAAFRAGAVIHITHPNPPPYAELASTLCDDLGIEGVRFFPVPRQVFRAGFLLLRTLYPGKKKEFVSASKYLPYITETYDFERSASRAYALPDPPPLTPDFLHGVNVRAVTEVFPGFRSASPSA